jgi:ABC-type branched-subunit amino acid transport system ATPase component
MTLIEAQGLCKSFGGLRAVDDVNFAVEAGSIVGIIGPNGAGKTTCFNLISRALPVTRGRILFDGQDVTALPAHQVARRGLARTFQATTLFAEASVLENVLVGYRQRTRAGVWDALIRSQRLAREERDAEEAGRETLGSVGLADLAERTAGGLTQEQQKRRPPPWRWRPAPLLLLDEPSSASTRSRHAGSSRRRVNCRRRRHRPSHRAPDAVVMHSASGSWCSTRPQDRRGRLTRSGDPAVLEAYLGPATGSVRAERR